MDNTIKSNNENDSKNIRYCSNFQVGNKVFTSTNSNIQKTILLFAENEIIHFTGALHIKVLYGAIDICGCMVTKESGIIPIFSQLNAPILFLISISPPIEVSTIDNSSIKELVIDTNMKISCVLELYELNTNYLQNPMDFRVNSQKKRKYPSLNISLNVDMNKIFNIKSAYFIMCDYGDLQLFKIPSSWLYIKQNLLEKIDETNRTVLVLGKISSGKSTFSRFILNQLINKYGSAALLDCDPGQSELTPPGLVSLSVIESPLLAQPYINQLITNKTIVQSHFIGDTTPKICPERYLNAILNLYKLYNEGEKDIFYQDKNMSQRIPIIINTNGWVDGVGKDLLVEMIREIQPHFVVQIFQGAEEGVYKPIIDLTQISNENYKPIEFIFNPIPIEPNSHQLSATEKRALQIKTYFGTKISIIDNLFVSFMSNSQNVYKVPWSKVFIHFPDHNVPPSQSLYALNGSIVGLVRTSQELVKLKTISSLNAPKLLYSKLNPEQSDSVGLGIIKIIDPEAQLFFITTPLDINLLKDVNVLVKSKLEMNVDLLMNDSQLYIPYLTSDSIPGEGTGSTEMKSRNNILRRKFDPKR